MWPIGILSPSVSDRGQSIRGISVLGGIGRLEFCDVALLRSDVEVRNAQRADVVVLAILNHGQDLRVRLYRLAFDGQNSFERKQTVDTCGAGLGETPRRSARQLDLLAVTQDVHGERLVVERREHRPHHRLQQLQYVHRALTVALVDLLHHGGDERRVLHAGAESLSRGCQLPAAGWELS